MLKTASPAARATNPTRLRPPDVLPLVLPFSRRPAAEEPFQPRTVPVTVSSETAQGLITVSSDPARAFLAAWFVLLWRFTDQSEITLGVVTREQTLLPLAASFTEEMSFRDIVQQLHAARNEAERNQSRVEWQNPGVFLPPVFCVEDGLPIIEGGALAGKFQIALCIRWDGARWNLALLYDSASLPCDTVERMSRSFTTLLTGAAIDPDSPAYALPILNEEDWNEVVITFNHTASFYPADECIHQLFEEQVERTPDRVALRDRTQCLTYRQLNGRANRLAHFLRRQGAKPNSPVGLFVDRSAEMIVGLLAILKSGACYLPLVPTDPQARVARLLADTNPAMVLTTEALAPSLPGYEGRIALIDQPCEEEPSSNPKLITNPDDLVYVLFTSGSTGVPKGVATRHRNLVNYTYFICRQLQLENYPEGWHFATVSTLAADLGNTSIFAALTSGGCLHVIDYETAMTPAQFAAYMKKHPIDLLKIAPSHLAALLRDSEGDAVLPRRFVIVGGEKLTWDLLQEIRKRGTCAIMNHCGPTETTIGCCTLIVSEEAFAEWGPATVPLGRPIANDQIYILDRRMQPVPVGVPGELYMSGAGLSRGYYNQPELTAERFLSHPFSSNPAERLYRTGDLGRFLPDGTIEFLGRVDHQVKIRGFRVEPAELEAALKRHRDVKQAVVVSEENRQKERVLVAYIAALKPLRVDAVREFLAGQVPDYMLPARLVIVDELPLNANGKIDLQALPELERKAQDCEEFMVAARTAEEEKLAAIWCEVLARGQISVEDNFFALGGHSLLATRIIARIRKVFQVNFPLSAFLENPTIRATAAKLGDYDRLIRPEDELARLVQEVAEMSEEEAMRLLAEEEP